MFCLHCNTIYFYKSVGNRIVILLIINICFAIFRANMTTVEWQTTCTDLKQRGALLLETEEWADCTLLIGHEGTAIKAHKLMLAMASPVFESMFYDLDAREKEIFNIPDVKHKTFEALLQYIYTENININSFKRANKLYLAANKYLITQLARVCAEFMCSNITMETACAAYEAGARYQDHMLMYESSQIIKLNIREIIHHKSFEEADIDTVAKIFSIGDLPVEEMELFQALERHEKAHASRKRSASPLPEQSGSDAKPRRSVRKALSHLRFLSLTAEQFARGPARSGLLSPAESLAVLVNIAGGGAPMPQGFCTDKQPRLQRPKTPVPRPMAPTSGTLRVSVSSQHARWRSRVSAPCQLMSRPWRLRVLPVTETATGSYSTTRYLGVQLRCDSTESSSWACVAHIEFRLRAATHAGTDHTAKLTKTFSSTALEHGHLTFIKIDEALSSRFLVDDNLLFEANVVTEHAASSSSH